MVGCKKFWVVSDSFGWFRVVSDGFGWFAVLVVPCHIYHMTCVRVEMEKIQKDFDCFFFQKGKEQWQNVATLGNCNGPL